MPETRFNRLSDYMRNHWLNPRRVRFWLLVAAAAYTLVGFFVLPWLIHAIAVDTVRDKSGHELDIEAVHTNPFTLTLQVNGLTLSDGEESPLLYWDKLFTNLSWSSAFHQTWTFSAIRLDGLVVTEERFASGETRVTRLLDSFGSDTPAETPPESDGRPALRVEEMRVEDAAIHFSNHLKDPTAADSAESNQSTMSVQSVSFAMDGFTLQDDAHHPAQLQGQFHGGGEFAFDGRLQLLPIPALEGEARIKELALAPFEPYLRQLAIVRIDSGTLSLDGTVRRQEGEPLAFLGTARIDTLGISEDSGDETLIGWRVLRTDRLDLRLGERRLETDAIRLEDLSGQVLIREDRSTNFGRLLVSDESQTDNSETSAAPDPLAITIEGIDLTGGSVQFTDHSLPLPFSTNIQGLSGSVSTLSSESTEPAQVALEGQVEDYGLVSIGGTVHAWHPMRETNLQATFRNIKIPDYSPYTVRFAGRRIAAGTMDLDLNYTITDRQLDGRNNIILRDLELGERMDAPNAMDLPLDLALALLKDSDGVINLDLPVSGNVGEPEFDIGQVIRQALGNALVSAAQAPFRFLANLVGADSENLGKVEFLAGRSDLTPPEHERIDTLREALIQRPALALELAGPFDPELDGPPLRRQSAMDELRARLAEAGREVDEPSLTAEATQETVEAMFASHYPESDLAAVRARFTEADQNIPGEETFDGLAYRNHLTERVMAAQPVSEADLKALANARASAVRNRLAAPETGEGIAEDRLRLLDPTEVDSDGDQRVAMEIGIAPH